MRATNRILGLFAFLLVCVPAIFGQTNPPPSDPHEMVTSQPQTLTKPADRNAALDLLDRARQNYDLRGIGAPYSLKVSFETNGSAQNEGEGTMEELSDGATIGGGRRKCRIHACCESASTAGSMARMRPRQCPCAFNSCAPPCIGRL